MKLRALEIEQFRKFTHPVRLTGFGDRVNLLCGPNEFGKSTMLAAVRGLLFERHNSKAEPIKRMQNRLGNAAPRLAMEFETGGGTWRIEKRFLHQPMARLTAPDGARFDGDAAEETLQRVLGFGASGKQGATPGQMGVWGALWVTQRDSVIQADLSSEIARLTITSCLDAEVGIMTGNEKGQALKRAAREQLAQLLDGNGRPKGRYGQVVANLRVAEAKLVELRDRAERLTADSMELRTHERLLERESDPAAEERDLQALEDARRRGEAALLHEQRMEAAQSALALAERDYLDGVKEQQTRTARTEAVAKSQQALEASRKASARMRAAVAEAETAEAMRRAALAGAQTHAAKAAGAARRLHEVTDFVRRAATLAEQGKSLEKAEAAQGRVNALSAALDAMRISAVGIDAVRKASRELDNARSVLDAQATQIDFDLLPGRAGQVAVAGQPLVAERGSITVAEETELLLEGIGRIRVRPAIRDRQKLFKRLATAQDGLAAALVACGSADLSEAERHYATREALERDLGDARAVVARLAPGDAQIGLGAGLGALREYVDTMRRRVEESRRRWR